ncbi:MAG: AbrB/MazE/SpoVT family DNA-binding domain-containing protein [Chloroflexota bacterium]|nr:AbrB/MazE/SpoVT family DNA-binding domain-containing protein [Chloroflexota bacterium]
MRIRVAKVGTRNRIVLPPEVMDVLGVNSGDAVFFVIRGPGVQLSRSPENYEEYLLLHSETLPAPEDFDLDEVDSCQIRFPWAERGDPDASIDN